MHYPCPLSESYPSGTSLTLMRKRNSYASTRSILQFSSAVLALTYKMDVKYIQLSVLAAITLCFTFLTQRGEYILSKLNTLFNLRLRESILIASWCFFPLIHSGVGKKCSTCIYSTSVKDTREGKGGIEVSIATRRHCPSQTDQYFVQDIDLFRFSRGL